VLTRSGEKEDPSSESRSPCLIAHENSRPFIPCLLSNSDISLLHFKLAICLIYNFRSLFVSPQLVLTPNLRPELFPSFLLTPGLGHLTFLLESTSLHRPSYAYHDRVFMLPADPVPCCLNFAPLASAPVFLWAGEKLSSSPFSAHSRFCTLSTERTSLA
jgi:hypothetical protein